jgi:hypothetical protein
MLGLSFADASNGQDIIEFVVDPRPARSRKER